MSNTTSTMVQLEVLYIRARGWLRFALQLAGVAILLIGAYNMLAAPVLDVPVVAPYRGLFGTVIHESSILYIGDFVCMALGAILTVVF